MSDIQNPIVKTQQARWRSPVLWSSVIAEVVALMLLAGVIDVGLGDVITKVAAGVMTILTLFGILNDPTNKTGF